MKTILQILKVLTMVFLVRLIDELVVRIIKLFQGAEKTPKFFGTEIPKNWESENIIICSIIILFLTSLLMYLIVVFRKVVVSFAKNDFFTTKNGKQLSIVGKGLLLYGICFAGLKTILFFNNLNTTESSGYKLLTASGKAFSESITVFWLSIFMLLIASIIKEGNTLKQENDLTI